MGKQATILRALIACPEDLAEEVAAADVVVRELNSTLAESLGVHIELIFWKTHAYPGIGSDPQAVINDQIGDNYDIFIGILSTRFGSPTKRAGSGTAEEFERAYKRFQDDPEQLRVMFYFKEPEMKVSELDLDQYALVRAFQSKLGSERGVLYWPFSSTDEFSTYLRVHLGRQLQDWAKGAWGGKAPKAVPVEEARTSQNELVAVQVDEDSDIGYLDLIERGLENLETTTATLNRMLEALNELTDKITENTTKLNDAVASNDIGRMKYVANHIAEVMDQYADRMDTELPIFSRSFSVAMDAVSRTATVWRTDFQSQDTSQIRETYTQIQALGSGIGLAREQMVAMEESVSGLPRLTTAFNRAKKHTKTALNSFNSELTTAINLAEETAKELRRILEEDR
jgi:DNA-binding XRE family transcriptional regulator